MATESAATPSTKIRQVVVGGLIVAATIATFFWWGFHFQVFGSDIDWFRHPAQLGFPALVVIGAFGSGYQVGGRSAGLRTMAWVGGLLVVAIALGAVRQAI